MSLSGLLDAQSERMEDARTENEKLRASLKEMLGLYEAFAGEDECDYEEDGPCGAPICKAIKGCAVDRAACARRLVEVPAVKRLSGD